MISVIVPVYKVEAYLHRCIDSILSQSYSDFELILVDDGSPDRCGEICDEYAQKDARITVIHQENGGLSAARNAGIEYALGTDSEWISFIDSDDWVHPEYLKSLLGAAEQYETDIASCAFQRTDGEISAVEAISFDAISPEEYWCNSSVNATVSWGKIYRKELFSELRFPVGKIHEDEFTTYKCLFELNTLAVSNAELYYYFQNPNGIMKSEWTPERMAAFEALDEQIDYFRKFGYRDAMNERLWSLMFRQASTYFTLCPQKTYSEYRRVVHRNLRSEVRANRKSLEMSMKTYPYIYEAAFPIRTKIYLHFSSAAQVLRAEGIRGLFGKIKSKFTS